MSHGYDEGLGLAFGVTLSVVTCRIGWFRFALGLGSGADVRKDIFSKGANKSSGEANVLHSTFPGYLSRRIRYPLHRHTAAAADAVQAVDRPVIRVPGPARGPAWPRAPRISSGGRAPASRPGRLAVVTAAEAGAGRGTDGVTTFTSISRPS